MFKSKVLRRLLLVIVALGVAGYATYELKTYMEKNAPREQVLVAKEDILAYTVISSSDLGYMNLPVGSKMPNSIQEPRQIIGKMARSNIYRGEQIIPQKLADSPLVLNDNERSVGIPLDAVRAVGLTIRPGDHVDIYWLQDPTSQALPGREGESQIRPALMVAEDATIFDIIDESSATAGENGIAPAQPDRKKVGGGKQAIVVVKIKQTEVQGVVTAVGNGLLYLAKKRQV